MADHCDVVPLSEAPGLFPGRPNIATIWRWTKHGVRGIKLESVIVGARIFISPAAAERFMQETAARRNGTALPSPIDTVAVRKAEAILNAAGV